MSNDGFDMFGSDDEYDDEVGESEVGAYGDEDKQQKEAIAFFLSTFFLKRNPQVKLKDRIVGVSNPTNCSVSAFEQRGFSLISINGSRNVQLHLDAIVFLDPTITETFILTKLLPGGIMVAQESTSSKIVDDKDFLPSTPIEQSRYVGRAKRSVRAHASTCPWLPSSFSHQLEQEHLQQATVALSANEIQLSKMTEWSKKQAVESMRENGYVVIRNLLRQEECQKWGSAVLESVHTAAEKLLTEAKVNILDPQNSENEPQSYREMSMREDLRLDLRDGPPLSKLRNDTDDTGKSVCHH